VLLSCQILYNNNVMRYIFYVVIKPRLWSDQLLHATPKHKDTVWQLAAGTTL
jgi:hypothetical protein